MERIGNQGRNRPAVWWALRTMDMWLHMAHLSHSLPLLPESCCQILCIRVYHKRTSMLTCLEKSLNIQMHLL